MTKLVLASGNPGKVREFSALLAHQHISVLPQSTFAVPEAEEPFSTFIENALAKARHASRWCRLPALADDSGICVSALGGAPGVRSARLAGAQASGLNLVKPMDAANNQVLIDLLSPHADKHAYYYCVLVLLRHADDPQPLIADGYWHGEIINLPRGSGGFGYDPHFWLPGLQKTAAELSPEEKNQLSHRAQAMHSLLAQLNAHGDFFQSNV